MKQLVLRYRTEFRRAKPLRSPVPQHFHAEELVHIPVARVMLEEQDFFWLNMKKVGGISPGCGIFYGIRDRHLAIKIGQNDNRGHPALEKRHSACSLTTVVVIRQDALPDSFHFSHGFIGFYCVALEVVIHVGF